MARTIDRIRNQINSNAESIEICTGCLRKSIGRDGLNNILAILLDNNYIFKQVREVGTRRFHIYIKENTIT